MLEGIKTNNKNMIRLSYSLVICLSNIFFNIFLNMFWLAHEFSLNPLHFSLDAKYAFRYLLLFMHDLLHILDLAILFLNHGYFCHWVDPLVLFGALWDVSHYQIPHLDFQFVECQVLMKVSWTFKIKNASKETLDYSMLFFVKLLLFERIFMLTLTFY